MVAFFPVLFRKLVNDLDAHGLQNIFFPELKTWVALVRPHDCLIQSNSEKQLSTEKEISHFECLIGPLIEYHIACSPRVCY